MPRTLSETLFEQYCSNRSIRFRQVAVSTERTPDYDLFLPRRKVIVEVKEISENPTERALTAQAKSGVPVVHSFSPGDRIRKKILDASGQLRSRTRGRYPGLLVVFGTGGSQMHIGPYQVRVAMYGFETLHFVVPDDPKQAAHVSHVTFGRKRRLTPDTNTSISAVATLTTPRPDTLDMRIYHNQHAAVPLPPQLFARYGVPQYRLGPATAKAPQWEEIHGAA
ncbi:MAG: hypothetical protein KF892_24125 [Rhizobacter sp.]|nr:hypothetical protein [Rhizobacter sp.]